MHFYSLSLHTVIDRQIELLSHVLCYVGLRRVKQVFEATHEADIVILCTKGSLKGLKKDFYFFIYDLHRFWPDWRDLAKNSDEEKKTEVAFAQQSDTKFKKK